jgi:cytidine deaminase
MKKISINTSFSVFSSLEELPNQIQNLMQLAIDARKKAYAPYSKFRVGAAIMLENGEIVIGSNQENAAYPSGLCAERVAIFHAGALYPNIKISQIAITAASDNGKTFAPIPPCGACRQSMAEYESKQQSDLKVYFMGETGEIYLSDSISNLLPLTFDNSVL